MASNPPQAGQAPGRARPAVSAGQGMALTAPIGLVLTLLVLVGMAVGALLRGRR